MFGTNLLIDILELVIAIIIGTIVVKFVYKKEFGESFVFVIVIQIYRISGSFALTIEGYKDKINSFFFI